MSETGVQPLPPRRQWRSPRAVVRGVGFDMRTAASLRPVQAGFLGSVFLAVGSLTPAYLPQSSPYWALARSLGLDGDWVKVLGTAFVLAGVGLLMTAWFSLRSKVYTKVKHWAVLVWWSVPLLFAPPIFSHDAYSYAAQGWLIHNGLNPYLAAPGNLPGPFADQVATVWRYTSAPYGPLALKISHGLVELVGLNPYYSAVVHRVPALLGVALIVYFLPRIARLMNVDPRSVAWFSTINPLVIIDFVGGAHNDALMVGCIVTALWLAYRGHMLGALVLVGVGAAIKQPAILAVYPVAIIGSGWASWRVRQLAKFALRLAYAFAVAIAVFCGISVASGLGFGWLNAVTVPGMVVTLAPFSLLGWGLQMLIDPGSRVVWTATQTLGLVLFGATTVWLAIYRSRTRPIYFLAWSYLAFSFFGPALHPWYLTWGGLLLPLTKPGPRTWRIAGAVVSVLLVYGAGNLAWRNDVVALALAALVGALIVLARRRQKMSASAGTMDT